MSDYDDFDRLVAKYLDSMGPRAREELWSTIVNSYRGACVIKDVSRLQRSNYLEHHFEAIDEWMQRYNKHLMISNRWDNRRRRPKDLMS